MSPSQAGCVRQVQRRIVFVVACANSYALGGTVEFGKGTFDVNAPAPVMMDVTVVADFQYDFADILFGSDDVPITDLVYSEEWTSAFSFVADPLVNVGFYPYDLFSSSTNATPVGPRLNMGMLVVDPTGLGLTQDDAGTELLIEVKCHRVSGIICLGKDGDLMGMGTINIVPELTTLVLLDLSILMMVWRRA